MGYTTTFDGEFTITPPLSQEHSNYLAVFSETRRMKRDADRAALHPDPLREAVGLPVGDDGCYFVSGSGFCGPGDDESVVSYNEPPSGQPGLWCKWTPLEGGAYGWNGSEKFYDYVEWLEYVVRHFLAPWGYTLNGVVSWEGEEQGDVGKLTMRDNVLDVAWRSQ